jgi:hypothetical protein
MAKKTDQVQDTLIEAEKIASFFEEVSEGSAEVYGRKKERGRALDIRLQAEILKQLVSLNEKLSGVMR